MPGLTGPTLLPYTPLFRSAVRSADISAAPQLVRQRVEVSPQVARGLGDRVATELLQAGVGEDQRHHRLGNDTCGGNRADVGPLVVGGCWLSGGRVDGA